MIEVLSPEEFVSDCVGEETHIAMIQLAGLRAKKPRLASVSEGFLKMLGYQHAADLKDGFYDLVWPADRRRLSLFYDSAIAQPLQPYQDAYRLKAADGSFCWVMAQGCFYEKAAGELCTRVLFVDITSLKTEEERLRREMSRIEVGMRSAKICFFEVELKTYHVTYFKNAEDVFGISGQEIIEQMAEIRAREPEDFQEVMSEYLCHPDDAEMIAQACYCISYGRSTSFEARMKAANGKFIWCRVDLTPIMENSMPVRMIGVITNINDIRLEANLFREKANHDLFTGLLNKEHTQTLIQQVLTEDPHGCYGLILLDVDNLKHINDTYGHTAGDETLLDVSQTLKELFGPNDLIGRFGGDEFIIFMENVCDRQNVISRVRAVLSAKFCYGATQSVGIAFSLGEGMDFAALFRKADAALYQAKKKKHDLMVFRPTEEDPGV